MLSRTKGGGAGQGCVATALFSVKLPVLFMPKRCALICAFPELTILFPIFKQTKFIGTMGWLWQNVLNNPLRINIHWTMNCFHTHAIYDGEFVVYFQQSIQKYINIYKEYITPYSTHTPTPPKDISHIPNCLLSFGMHNQLAGSISLFLAAIFFIYSFLIFIYFY